MRASFLLCVVLLGTPGCLAHSDSSATTASPIPAVSTAPSLPPGLPPSFESDVPPEDVPAPALIPIGAEVTGHWETSTAAGDAIVVAWSVPGQDPFRQDRGIAAWRRFADGGLPWRPVWGMAFPARRDPLLGLSTEVADVTGDGSADAIVFAERGGSGGCGTTLVVDLASGTEVFREEGCDRRVDASVDPVGLTITEAVFAPGDPHCCPSSVRTTTLVYADGAWERASSTTSPV
ncbi:MAG: hypothetical protein ACHQAW_04375 [Actinomycetota bacterium]